jgi:predicted secreted hydrolase
MIMHAETVLICAHIANAAVSRVMSFLSKMLDGKGLGQTKVRQEPFHTSHKGWTGMFEQLDSLVPGS